MVRDFHPHLIRLGVFPVRHAFISSESPPPGAPVSYFYPLNHPVSVGGFMVRAIFVRLNVGLNRPLNPFRPCDLLPSPKPESTTAHSPQKSRPTPETPPHLNHSLRLDCASYALVPRACLRRALLLWAEERRPCLRPSSRSALAWRAQCSLNPPLQGIERYERFYSWYFFTVASQITVPLLNPE